LRLSDPVGESLVRCYRVENVNDDQNDRDSIRNQARNEAHWKVGMCIRLRPENQDEAAEVGENKRDYSEQVAMGRGVVEHQPKPHRYDDVDEKHDDKARVRVRSPASFPSARWIASSAPVGSRFARRNAPVVGRLR